MSYIDLFKHKEIGEFGYLPIYLLEEDVNDPNELIAKKGDIVIGGGGGEHPMMKPKNQNNNILLYLENLYESSIPEDQHNEKILNTFDKLIDNEERNPWDATEFLYWGLDNYARLVKYKEAVDFSDTESTEVWLVNEIGKMIVEKFPELNPYKELTMVIQNEIEEYYNSLNIGFEL